MQRPHHVSSANTTVKKTTEKTAPAPGSSAIPPKAAPAKTETKRATARLVRPPSDPRIDEQRDHLAAVDHAHRQQRRWTLIVMGVSLVSAGLLYAMLDRQTPVVIQVPPSAPINYTDTKPTAPTTGTTTSNTTAQSLPTQTRSATQASPVHTVAEPLRGNGSTHSELVPTAASSTAPVAVAAQPSPLYNSTGTPDPLTLAAAQTSPPPPAESAQPPSTDVPSPPPPAIDSNVTAAKNPSVSPEVAGMITLPASAATITTKGARLMAKGSSNPFIGGWNEREGGLTWTTNIPQAGRYAVTITYACNKSGAGGVMKISAGSASITETTVDTGSWDTFAPHQVHETLDITQTGDLTITLEPQAKKSAAFMKFSSLVLTPVMAAP